MIETFESVTEKNRIALKLDGGRFLVRTIDSPSDLREAYALRYQVFKAESIKNNLNTEPTEALDQDEYDALADHLAIFDQTSGQMIATCRLMSSQFSDRFYSESEFQCAELLARPEAKLEIGRVCVHADFRRGIVIMLLWRGIAEYMLRSNTEILFGCGSILTESAQDASVLYRYLRAEGKEKHGPAIAPAPDYQCKEFELLMNESAGQGLTLAEKLRAALLIPPLCKSYFDLGCYIVGPPAFDRDFRCIDFLTVLEVKDLSPRVRKKMFGVA